MPPPHAEGSRSRSGSQHDETRSVSGAGARLPAVKGTLGGIESPRQRHRHMPSTSTIQGDDPSRSSTPTALDAPRGDRARAAYPDIGQGNGFSPYTQSQRPQPIFRSDPTMRTTFDTLPLEKKEEIKRLFLS